MDSPPPSPKIPLVAASSKPRRALWRFLAIAAVICFVLAVAFSFVFSPKSQFTWLTPAQVSQATRSGPLTLLKYKLIKWAGPLMRYYYSHRPSVRISANIFTMSPGAEFTNLDTPFATNVDGTSVWILSPQELATFREELKNKPEGHRLNQMTIQTSSGTWAGMRINGTSYSVAPGIFTNIGTTLDTVAKFSSGSINLLVDTRSTELAGAPTTNGPVIRTNFSAACRVLLPDAGGLVIHCGNVDAANPTNYWLIVSPVLVDATGKPIKQ